MYIIHCGKILSKGCNCIVVSWRAYFEARLLSAVFRALNLRRYCLSAIAHLASGGVSGRFAAHPVRKDLQLGAPLWLADCCAAWRKGVQLSWKF